MISSAGKFKRVPLANSFGSYSVTAFGINIFNSLLNEKEWIVLVLDLPYFQVDQKENDPKEMDIFSEMSADELHRLQFASNTFFMLNYLWEGNGHTHYNFWELLTCSALRHNIPLEKIFFISSNLKNEEQYNIWQSIYYPNSRINVICFNFFADYVQQKLKHNISIDTTVKNIKEDQKFFLSLNRRKRSFRIYTIYKIFESNFYKNTAISYDKLVSSHPQEHPEIYQNIDPDIYQRLMESSPAVLDFSDFEQNWACEPKDAIMPSSLFDKSLISLVGETLFETNGSTELFYSEKTFKPMLFNHPIMIFGQPGLNTYLETVGFKNYSCYFDLSFDNIENHVTRINAQVSQLEVLNDRLSGMKISQRIEWFLQGRETLEYNKEALRAQDFNKKKLQKLIDIVKSITE
jgi:hypothetical protein